MTDTQILTLALTLLGIFAASWFNNSRIGDVNSRIGDVRDVLRAELKAETGAIRNEMKLGFADLVHRIEKMDDTMARLFADHEARLNKLEEKK